MIVVISIIAALLLLGFGVSSLNKCKGDSIGEKDVAYVLITFGSIFIFVLMVVIPSVYANNAQGIAEWERFRETNVENYSITVDETRAILSKEEFIEGKVKPLVEGSVEKIEVGKVISERIKEWRDSINEYNRTVASMERVRGLWIYPGFMIMPPIPDNLTPLKIR